MFLAIKKKKKKNHEKTWKSNRLTLRFTTLFHILNILQVPVPALKEQIASVTGVLSEQQRLICRGKVLKDDQLLSAYRIQIFLTCGSDFSFKL